MYNPEEFDLEKFIEKAWSEYNFKIMYFECITNKESSTTQLRQKPPK